LAHKLGSQSFLPETLDKECDKAASILKSFCSKLSVPSRNDTRSRLLENGVYADPGASPVPTSTDPKATETNDSIIDPTKQKPKSRVIVTIPPKVIAKAVGLAIFTTLRAGFNFSGATGSGILIARLPDGSWGPPSGIQVHSVGAGFLVGLDIYDCVCVINSREALAAFANTRVALGSDLAVVAGPYGAGGAVEFGTAMEGREGRKSKEGKEGESSTQPPPEPAESNQNLKPEKDKKSHRRSLSASAFKPVFSYVKSRGFYAGVQVDGTVVVERKDANAAFFGERVSVDKIIKGEVPRQGPNGMWPAGARNLLETLKGAEVGSLKVKQSKDGASPTSPTFGAPGADHSAPVASGALGTGAASGSGQPPAYKDDGTHHPGVGDVKYR
jgi:lipid-binding SYLF domain-containing protein